MTETEEVRKWFLMHVTCDGEAYTIDAEQARAVACDGLNTIVVARAGSGKTRTIVAKMVYLMARKGLRPDEMMAFVFNANAAAEINARLARMCVDGIPVVGAGGGGAVGDDGKSVDVGDEENVVKRVRVATTFHAFARRIVYDACGGKDKCGKILAGEKDEFVLATVQRMLIGSKWRDSVWRFIRGNAREAVQIAGERGKVVEAQEELTDEEVARFAGQMMQFVNRAQQKFLAGENTLKEAVRVRLAKEGVGMREKIFIKLGTEVFNRYHWYLLEGKLAGFEEYGTDFNLIISWASKLIAMGRGKAREILAGKKYILIDEYQDFSQLFLAMVLAIRTVVPDVKIIVVGDDWQAINRFAGSDVEYFKRFERYFPEDYKRLEITTNYRCDKEIVSVARRFMKKAMREKGNFRAFSRKSGKVVLVEPNMTPLEYGFVDYDERVGREDKIFMVAARKMTGRIPKASVARYLKTLVKILAHERDVSEIMLLHRNNVTDIGSVGLLKLSNTLRLICEKLEIMSGAEYDNKVKIMTMHKSKGLESEVVIILEADEGVIPKMHPDTELYGIFGESPEVALDDQKRLFYVAITRAKRRLYIVHDSTNGVGFTKYLGSGVEKWEE